MSSRALGRKRGVRGSKLSVEDDQEQDMKSTAWALEGEKEIGVLLTLSLMG
jgi:hypothetical protein